MSEKTAIGVAVMAIVGMLLVTQCQQPDSMRVEIDVSKFGPQVGESVPDFDLTDQNGQSQTLNSIMGPKGAMLVFVRSADW